MPQIQLTESKDTLCIISIDQVKKINKCYIDKAECFEIKDSLSSTIDNYEILVADQKKLIASHKKSLFLKDEIITEKNNIIDNDKTMMKNKDGKIKSLKSLKFQRIVLVAVSVVLSVLLIR